ncbi:hypothetical protein [Aliidiomarina soli]|uniref:Uncharacterized protein n=1 Tax=Aliidiomarina soli TaxID=1928574 RepID=A0A432WMP6_9GAMM|nr:hypothetical protein [Aliidiomarina soli]RUO35092.1 hypothetical protein CWE14_03600 [Aliidiomarina soli]
MKISIGLVFVFLSVVVGVWLMDIGTDRTKVVEITAPVPAYTDWECGYANKSGCSVVFEVEADAKYDVQRIRYGKDFMAIKIQEGGSSGWIIYGEAVQVHAKPNA